MGFVGGNFFSPLVFKRPHNKSSTSWHNIFSIQYSCDWSALLENIYALILWHGLECYSFTLFCSRFMCKTVFVTPFSCGIHPFRTNIEYVSHQFIRLVWIPKCSYKTCPLKNNMFFKIISIINKTQRNMHTNYSILFPGVTLYFSLL